MSSTEKAAAPREPPAPTTTPSSFFSPPILRNRDTTTRTSTLQDQTVAECLPFLNAYATLNQTTDITSRAGTVASLSDFSAQRLTNLFSAVDYTPSGLLRLQREQHIEFLHDALSEFPGGFVAIDASRPWLIYWALVALYFLGVDVTAYRDETVKTFFPLQGSEGGYCGGEGYFSHLAGTYATLLSLAMVGGTDAYSLSDRRAMWEWLGRLKQANGGFRICESGEEDVRGAYCAMVAISLLNLPWELPAHCTARSAGLTTFGDGLGEYVSRCQTFEGGIAASPGNEAHGAYAFCAVACLCLLDEPHRSIDEYLDVDALLHWLSSRQYAPEGGFAGRSNKVVDGCYSQWLGGCWPLLQAALDGPRGHDKQVRVGNLYSTTGLTRYILNCCQASQGGLRDKPSKGPDSYHTCYTLCGLSAAEHYHFYNTTNDDSRFASAFTWQTTRAFDHGGEANEFTAGQDPADENDSDLKLLAVNPVFVIPHEAVLGMREWALQQGSIM